MSILLKLKKLFLLFFISGFAIGYSQSHSSYFLSDYFYGNIIANKDASAFLTAHPTNLFFSFNKKSSGNKEWEQHYNHPDIGYTFGYLDTKTDILEKIYSIYSHYNFHLTNRNSPNQIILSTGIGLAYNTNPYHKETNNKNTAFSTHLNSSSFLKLYFQREHLISNLGVNAGFSFIHTSNANVKSPNSGVNFWGVSVGLNYNLEPKDSIHIYQPKTVSSYFKEPIKLNLAVRGGVNESEIIRSGQRPFFVASAYVDKRLNRKTAIQFGADLFITPMLKDYYNLSLTIPHINLKETDEFSRVGLFVGHELFLNKTSLETQVGYYVKYPFEYHGRIYETLTLKRYLNKKWFAAIRLKVHAADAESVEFGFGVRL